MRSPWKHGLPLSPALLIALGVGALLCAAGCGKNRIWQSQQPLFSGAQTANPANSAPAVAQNPALSGVPQVSITQNDPTPPIASTTPRSPASPATVVVDDARFAEVQRRATDLERNNESLHKQLAGSKQQQQALQDQVTLLQSKLSETVTQLRDTQVARDEADRRAQTILASAPKNGASFQPNNSMLQPLKMVQMPGLDVQQKGDVLRIAVPADKLFQRASVEWSPGATTILDQIAIAISRHYPRQLITIEGHTDNAVIGLPGGNQQLAASQSLAVFQYLTARNALAAKQLVTQACGPNYPRVSNAHEEGRAQNRRIEFVIYPEQIP